MQAAWVVLVKVKPNRWEGHGLKPWIEAAKKRLHHNVLAIALANKLPPPPTRPRRETRVMDGERELTAGLLSKDANFRLIVSGTIGVKEIERLIKKLELDKEILAEQSDDDEAAN